MLSFQRPSRIRRRQWEQKPRKRVKTGTLGLLGLLLVLLLVLAVMMGLMAVFRENHPQIHSPPSSKSNIQPPFTLRGSNSSPNHQLQGGVNKHPMILAQKNDTAAGRDSSLLSLPQQQQQQHTIPNVLIFTHYINLLEAHNLTGEDQALQRNVYHTIDLHPGATVRFLTDEDCLASIRNVLGEDTPLVDFFVKESHGMYKADICRGAALYETGGLYFDVDLGARMNMFEAIVPSSSTLVVPLVHKDSKYPGSFFQAFIGSSKENPILLRYLQLFCRHYQGHLDLKGPLGVVLLRKAHDDVVLPHDSRHQLSNATAESSPQQQQVVTLWQEVLYNRKLFPHVPPPTWGTRRACHFVVVSPPYRVKPWVVPLYSRVAGSRMCGGKDSTKKK